MSLIDLPAERAALACTMLNAGALDDLRALGLKPSHFHRPAHGVLWGCIVLHDVFDAGSFFGRHEAELKSAGVSISEVMSIQGAPAHLSKALTYGQAVIASYRCRSLREVCAEVVEGLAAGELDFDAAGEMYDRKFTEARDDANDGSEPESLESMMHGWLKDRRAVLTGEAMPRVISSGMRALDALMPLGLGHQVIVAGRPKMGKTQFALTVAMNVARHHGPVLFCSAEMGRAALQERIADHELDHSTLQRFDHGAARLVVKAGQCKDLFFDYRNRTAQKVEGSVRRWHRKKKLALVVIDYLQLLGGDDKDERQRIASASGRFKRMAADLEVPLLTLAQLNRDCEKRDDKRPQAWDLKGSGDIEQDADSILMLYRGSVYGDEGYPEHRCEALLRASRWAPAGRAFLQWTPGSGWFTDEEMR